MEHRNLEICSNSNNNFTREKKISIGILTGGKSVRMGKNKAFLPYCNQTFLHRLLQEFSSWDDILLSVDQITTYADFISDLYDSDGKYEPCKNSFSQSCIPTLVEDVNTNIGPMEGIYQVLKSAKHNYVFICAVDMPYLKMELVSYMVEFISSDYDCYTITDNVRSHPLCTIYSKTILPIIESQIQKKEFSLASILNTVRTKYISIETSCFSPQVIANINTEKEYQEIIIPAIFCVSGTKNSGKTTLITKLIPEFQKDGKKVSVIKHDGHDFQIDRDGTDTYRFQKAGAAHIGIFSSHKNACIEYKPNTTLNDMISKMKGADILIIEGMKNSPYPKVEVVRKEVSPDLVCDLKTILCIATNAPIHHSINKPIYGLDDIASIYQCIKKNLQLS